MNVSYPKLSLAKLWTKLELVSVDLPYVCRDKYYCCYKNDQQL